jgi:hypothetical protein
VERAGWASLCVGGDEQPYPAATFSDAAGFLTKEIGASTALITQCRTADMDELPEVQSDEARAAVDRVILAIKVECMSVMRHL